MGDHVQELEKYTKLLEILAGGVISKEMVRGIAEHGYRYLPAFSYMINTLNVGTTYSIMVNKVDFRFMYYFLSLGPCIRGFAHMRKVIAIDNTYLYGKYEGVLLSMVPHDTENHIIPLPFTFLIRRMMRLGCFSLRS